MDGDRTTHRRRGDAVSRLLAVVMLAALWTAVAAAADAPPRRTIDLDQPGALETLQRANPAHHEKVRRIMEGVLQRPDTDVPRWIQASFAGRDVTYAPIVLTSHPPKRRLSFALDDTRYEAIVTLTNVRGEIVPAR
jgi:hypothetical protein